ncbi:MAG: hypothetical protein GXY65_05365 [Rhodococcus sp.]|uniref:hypothetical protein n=1 Tax=Rhodococcus TaxID=1827 RepID=UPI001694705F|nr:MULTISPECIES: hypothetical protein [Rhodococcus]NLV78764.1 hypothetical protein [Rhodococcus sp. (in: high G+C Gram-positive bacteria)]
MPRRRTLRLLTALGAAAVVAVAPAYASAEPAPPGVPLDVLRAEAAAQSPDMLAAVERLVADSGSANPFEPPPRNVVQPFSTPAPTLGPGCGGGIVPYAMTNAWVHPGPHAAALPGQIGVYVEPTVAAPIASSDLTFVWMNMEAYRGGIETLDQSAVGPLSTTVSTGGGAIMGALFGSIRYTNGAFCQVVYTMGGFFA